MITMKDRTLFAIAGLAIILLVALGAWAEWSGLHKRYCSSPWMRYTDRCVVYLLR